MNWDQIVQKVTPHIVRIETPDCYGTGFLCLYNDDRTWCGIATAAHVVSSADEWRKPIRIRFQATGEIIYLPPDQRVIYVDHRTDSAVILLMRAETGVPDTLIPLYPSGLQLGVGVEVGWLGFPAIEPYTLCFFRGAVSARQEYRNAYLIDGVAINGVSGGPVLYFNNADGVQIVGTVTAYNANRTSGEALPGLLIAQDVSHFHAVLQHVRSIDEANRSKIEFEVAQNK